MLFMAREKVLRTSAYRTRIPSDLDKRLLKN